MIRISTAQLWVHDQDEALAFWTEKVGFEIREDVTVPEMGNFRWLTVGPADQEQISDCPYGHSWAAGVGRIHSRRDRRPDRQGILSHHLPDDRRRDEVVRATFGARR